MSCQCNYVKPIVCPPQYVVRDYYTPQIVPVIHPVVTVNRQNIVNVPQHFVQQYSTNVVAAPQTVVAPQAGLAGGGGLFGGAGLFGGRRLF